MGNWIDYTNTLYDNLFEDCCQNDICDWNDETQGCPDYAKYINEWC